MKHLTALFLLLSILACGRNTPDNTVHDVNVAPQPPKDRGTPEAARSKGCEGEGSWTPGQTEDLVTTYGGQDRTFSVRLPPNYDPGIPAPVVFALHGGFGSAERTEESTKFNAVAAREGVIMIYPEGIPGRPRALTSVGKIRSWNAGGCCGKSMEQGVDDVGFLLKALDVVEQGACVDRSRVYSTGMSNGAMMSYRLACEAPERFAAVAAVAGMLVLEGCAPKRPIPLLHIHGIKDSNVPLDGSQGCGPGTVETRISIDQTINLWNTLHACDGDTTQTLAREDVTCTRKGSQCPVELCLLPQGNHTWPGGTPKDPFFPGCTGGQQVLSFSASEHIWGFFEAHTLDTKSFE